MHVKSNLRNMFVLILRGGRGGVVIDIIYCNINSLFDLYINKQIFDIK